MTQSNVLKSWIADGHTTRLNFVKLRYHTSKAVLYDLVDSEKGTSEWFPLAVITKQAYCASSSQPYIEVYTGFLELEKPHLLKTPLPADVDYDFYYDGINIGYRINVDGLTVLSLHRELPPPDKPQLFPSLLQSIIYSFKNDCVHAQRKAVDKIKEINTERAAESSSLHIGTPC